MLTRRMTTLDRKREHLATLAAIVRRMSLGALLLESWSCLTVAALLVVAHNPQSARFAWLALFLAITFWTLDAHFLRQKLLFRSLHERVQTLAEGEIDYTLDTSLVDREAYAWRSLFLQRRLVSFHGAVILAIVVVRGLA
jgi:hypothetical protein